ncbi:hypothetical protein JD969_01500 [Planctomycetota bacterium]|nr:hypothetical protein JD969_01500 [Planctomycetota bacterium]
MALTTGLVAALSMQTGCGQSREQMATIKPTYSFVQEGIKLAERSNETDMEKNLRFAKTNTQLEDKREQ